MATLFTLPLLGQTMQEGQILRWLKKEGDAIEGWEPLVEVLTDKVNMEVEPAISGVVRRILVPEGETVPVGAPIAIIAGAEESIDSLLAGLNGPPTPDPATGPQAPDRAVTSSPHQPITPSAHHPITAESPAISPRARYLAEERGMEWKTLGLAGTGFEGMIVERDITALLEMAQPERSRLTPLAARIAGAHGVDADGLASERGRVRAETVRRALAPSAAPDVREIRLTGVRKIIADRLSAIYQSAPHVPLRVDVDMTAAAEFRRQVKPIGEASEARLTYTHLIAAAVVQGLVAEPAMNATLEGDVIRQFGAVKLGVAVALDDGLTVPVLSGAERLSLLDLSTSIQSLAEKARAGKLPPDAYAGGTFTISPLGQHGVDSFDPILNPPQIGILGIGRIADRVVAYQGAPAVRPVVTLTLVFDHRAVDGAPAARLLGRIKDLLENPARLLM